MTALLLIGTVMVVVGIELIVALRQRSRARSRAPCSGLQAMRPPQPPFGLFVDSAHSWLSLHPDGSLRVGVDDFLVEALGQLDAVEVPPVGTRLERGSPLMTLRSGSRRLRIPSPASGEVVRHNHLVLESPATLIADPYGLGWVVALWSRDPKAAIAPLQVGPGAIAHLKAELRRLVDFLTTSAAMTAAPTLADGGLPVRGALAQLPDATWQSFQEQFLAQ